MRRATIRRRLATVTVAGLVTASAAVGLAGAQEGESGQGEEQIRTETTGLGGYSISGTGAPLSVRVFEPVSPSASFTDPGDPHAEANEAYSRARLSTGPDARALASSMWPGTLLGDGFGTITDQVAGESQSYPVEADARYPGGPETAAGPAEGQLMQASAKGLDVVARARSSEPPSPNTVGYGSATSRAEATVLEGAAVNRVDSAVSDVRILEGLVTVDSVRTTLEARSDAVTGTTGGTTEVNGLTIMGSGYTVDEDGVRPVEEDAGGEALLDVPSTLPGAEDLREQSGIEVRLVGHRETVDGAIAERSAGGLEVVVDTNKLREVIDTLPIQDAISGLPEDFRSRLAPALRLSPRIVYVFAAGDVRAAASPPPEFDLGLGGGALGDTGGPGSGATTTTDTGGDTAVAGGGLSSGSATVPDASGPGPAGGAAGGEAPAPAVAAPDEPASETASFQAGGALPGPVGGLGGGIVLLGLAAAGAASAGLRGLAAGLLGTGSDCTVGRPVGAPTWS